MSEWWSYRPADFLMFAPDTYWRLFELHNAAWWPLGLLANALVLVLAVALWRGETLAPRLAAGLMAVLCAAVAWAGERPLAQAELIGLAPDPTAVAGLGLLLHWRCTTARGHLVWWTLLVLGVLACLVSATTLATMQDPQAMAPLAAAAIAMGAALARRPLRQSRP
jgi:hypothetical protein